jgi:hypothetical protein
MFAMRGQRDAPESSVQPMSRSAPFTCAVLIGLVLAGCGSGSQDKGHAGDTTRGTPSKVVVTTAHGETFEFENFEVICPKDTEGEWGQDADIVYAVAGLGSEPPSSRREPMLILTVGAEVADGTTLTLPYDELWGEAETFVSAFITRVGRATELSAGVEESSGHIEIASASCEPAPSIDVRIDGTLHSEYSDGGKATVVGEVRAG